MERHFKLTDESKVNDMGVTLYRIISTRESKWVQKEGVLGGWVSSIDSISDNAWVFNEAEVYGNARISDNVRISGNAKIYGNTLIYGNALIVDNAEVFDDAIVSDFAVVCDNAKIYGYAEVYGNARISDNAEVFDYVEIYDNAEVFDDAIVCDEARIYGDARIYGISKVFAHAKVGNEVCLYSAFISDNDQFCSFNNFGSVNRSTTAFKNKFGNIFVICGCFRGSINEFSDKVEKVHGNNIFGQEYKLIIELIKIKFSKL